MGTQSPTYTDERERDRDVKNGEDHGRKFLMFHGLILRSQLIELIKNKVFFDETVGVSELWPFLISFQLLSLLHISLFL